MGTERVQQFPDARPYSFRGRRCRLRLFGYRLGGCGFGFHAPAVGPTCAVAVRARTPRDDDRVLGAVLRLHCSSATADPTAVPPWWKIVAHRTPSPSSCGHAVTANGMCLLFLPRHREDCAWNDVDGIVALHPGAVKHSRMQSREANLGPNEGKGHG